MSEITYDTSMRPPIDKNVLTVDLIEEEHKIDNIYNHKNNGKLVELINYYGNKVDDDMVKGNYESEHMKLFTILLSIQDGKIYY
jgi:hypothetical protein